MASLSLQRVSNCLLSSPLGTSVARSHLFTPQRRRSFVNATCKPPSDSEAQLLHVPISSQQWRQPVGQVLKEYCTSSPLKLQPSSYLIALSPSSSTHALSQADLIPSQTTSLTFYTFQAHALAREAFWRSAAFVLAATLTEAHATEKLRIAGAPALQSEGAGGQGFTLSWLVEPAEQAEQVQEEEEEGRDALQRAVNYANTSRPATPLSSMQLQQLGSKAQKLAARNEAFHLFTCSRAQAEQQLAFNVFKMEELAARYTNPNEAVRMLRLADYVDLAPPLGKPLLERSGVLRQALCVMDGSVATWLPVQANLSASTWPSQQILVRARGIAFPTKAQLSAHVAAQEAAQHNDHRRIGAAQSLFFTHPASPGTPFMLPNGTRLARKVERVVRDLYDVWGYAEVVTPQLMRKAVWQQSGHWANYRADMFGVKGFVDVDTHVHAHAKEASSTTKEEQSTTCCAAISSDQESEQESTDEFGLKPMNCPGHCIVFASAERSYRDLPIRYAEFSPLHRNESSGSLSGLTRVRRFHQDDAHVFCTPAQVSSEITSMLRMLTSAYSTFGFESFELVLSTRPAAYIGTLAEWDLAEASLRTALNASEHAWSLNEADGAFYGPKIDVRLVDAVGKKHQTATIQLDFQLPQRFKLRYALAEVDETSGQAKHAAPVMIHRAILGSVERFMALLIEQTQGKWPFWLSPRQAVVLPVASTPEHLAYAERVRQFLALGNAASPSTASMTTTTTTQHTLVPTPRPSHVFYVDVDASNERFAKRVRNAALHRYNFVLVVGDDEVRNETVRVRAREATPLDHSRGKPALEKEMGEWTLSDLRDLFCKLDSNHW